MLSSDSLYVSPKSLEDVWATLSEGDWTVLAGGTDIFPTCSARIPEGNILDISQLSELRGISQDGQDWRIGGLTTWTDIANANLPSAFDGLKLAALNIGALQIQNAGTVAGNLCNASPAADGVPPLLCLDAQVELSSASGIRTLPLEKFILGNRSTELRRGELLSAILLPNVPENALSSFHKLGSRSYLVISIAMVSVLIAYNEAGEVDKASVAVGACSPVALRLPELEQALLGKKDKNLADLVQSSHLDGLNPIDDIRASAEFRKDAVLEMIKRALA
ncbi:MAG: xanthine dehydrogenase family protein subunit M [Rhodospirillales bacterium]|jgi:CO/xanthine dehydrogenase FAD-binding subunit|nr:xanthine dehydrogenase family protein subunit M [Rhodospirillales bacterium]